MITTPERIDSIPAVSVSLIHDFRNPLATIRAGSEMLLRAGASDPQIQRIARNLQRASLRMQELLDEFFDACKEERGGVELTDIREPAMHAVERTADRAKS